LECGALAPLLGLTYPLGGTHSKAAARIFEATIITAQNAAARWREL
jgi:hypothetical protein